MSEEILGMAVEKVKDDKYVVPKKEIVKFYKEKYEIPEKALNALKVAQDEMIKHGYLFAADKVCKTHEPVTVQFGVGDGRIDVQAKGKTESPEIKVVDGKMIRTGNTVLKYGGCKVTIRKKVPTAFLKDGGDMAKASAKIEKSLSK